MTSASDSDSDMKKMIQKLIKGGGVLFGLLLLILSPSAVTAQEKDSLKYGVLPGFGYDSDNGLYLSIDFQRFNYSRDIQPFRSFSWYAVSYRSIGSYSAMFVRDQVRTLGTDVRTYFDGYISQNYGNYYPGRTLDDSFSKARFDTTEYYKFSSFMFNIGATTRVPLGQIIGIRRTDIKAGLRVVYEKPFDLAPDSYMFLERPVGWEGSTYLLAEAGYVFERRDSEFLPGSGLFYAFTLRGAVPGISYSNTALFNADFRWYRKLLDTEDIPHVVIAQRFALEHSMGDVPYWLTPNLGGGHGLRGYMWKRFTGDGTAVALTELRTWLVKLPWWDIRAGINLFADVGSSYDNNFKQWSPKVTWGFAGVFSIFNPDYFIKYEMGFSPEGAGVYLGTGYAF